MGFLCPALCVCSYQKNQKDGRLVVGFWVLNGVHDGSCVTRAPVLYFIRTWVALSFKVVSQWVSTRSVTPVRISTLFNILMPSTDPVSLITNCYCLIVSYTTAPSSRNAQLSQQDLVCIYANINIFSRPIGAVRDMSKIVWIRTHSYMAIEEHSEVSKFSAFWAINIQ